MAVFVLTAQALVFNLSGFFGEDGLTSCCQDSAGYAVAEPVNINAFAYLPVMQGMWQQKEVFDGTYTLDDLLDAHEMIILQAENKRRAQEYAEMMNGGDA